MAGFPPWAGSPGVCPSARFFYIFTCLFVWLHRVLAVACGIFVESRRLSPVVAQVRSG